jgi:glycerol-3-phosphate dehydrogenase
MVRDPSLLPGRRFDILVVGGGIVGCAIARDAAMRGLSVALVERDDFAAGTSSRTSKLVHGGLRYLEHGYIGLVRESCRERERLLKLAPHLVKPLDFLLPFEPGTGWPPYPILRLGLYMYDFFAGRQRVGGFHRGLKLAALLAAEPGLKGGRNRRGAAYYDAQMDDARLTLEVALQAASRGAVLMNHAEVTGFVRGPGGTIEGAAVTDRLSGPTFEVGARLVVNATGPWGDATLGLAGRTGNPVLGVSKGIHLVYSDALVTHGLMLRVRRDRQRIFFILPWQGRTLIGTTDTPFSGDAREARPDEADIAYLLEETAAALPGIQLQRERVINVFCGVRPLLAADKDHPSAASREHIIREEPRGLLSVLGGKFTTFRSMAEEAVDVIQERLGGPITPCPTRMAVLPGAVGLSEFGPGAGSEASGTDAPASAAMNLFSRYGSRAAAVLRAAQRLPGGLEPLCPHTDRLMGEVAFVAREEMAVTLGDILDRRLGLRKTAACGGKCAAETAARIAGPILGWNESEMRQRAEEYGQ